MRRVLRPFVFAALVPLAACGKAPRAPGETARAATAAGPSLRALQQEFDGALLPDQRRAVSLRAQADLEELRARILEGLEDPAWEWFEPAAKLAVELKLVAAVEPLLAAARDPSAPWRATALRCANLLQPLATAALARFLGEDDDALRYEALRALAEREDVPFAAVVPLLGVRDARVAGAAAAVVPLALAPEQLEILVRTEFGSTAAGVAVVRELGHRWAPDALVAAWQRRLLEHESELQVAILVVLRTRHEAIDRELLRRLVAGDGAGPVRFEALRSLLAARAVGADWLLEHQAAMPRPLRLLCGLGLLQHERREGAHVLFELAYGEAPPAAADGDGGEDADAANESAAAGAEASGPTESGAEPVEPAPVAAQAAPEPIAAQDAVAFTARRLLGRLADLPLHRGTDAFAAWCEDPKVARPEALVFAGSAEALFAPVRPR